MKRSAETDQLIKDLLPTINPLAEKTADLKYIPESKGYYLSPIGFVYSIRQIYQNSILLEPKKPSPQRNGYCNSTVYYYDGTSRSIILHIALMEAYRGKRPFMAQIHHKDHHRWNNSITNLIYVSPEVHYELHSKKDKYDAVAENKLFLEWWEIWHDELLEIYF